MSGYFSSTGFISISFSRHCVYRRIATADFRSGTGRSDSLFATAGNAAYRAGLRLPRGVGQIGQFSRSTVKIGGFLLVIRACRAGIGRLFASVCGDRWGGQSGKTPVSYLPKDHALRHLKGSFNSF
ncbi:hypothetical protein VX159_07385 [Dechloromonas sp. ZY10]|uniref:hypothetical protein n=1 Tax=Dechloromonas aquae TaxID=2664436 RepID=UPI003528E3A5